MGAFIYRVINADNDHDAQKNLELINYSTTRIFSSGDLPTGNRIPRKYVIKNDPMLKWCSRAYCVESKSGKGWAIVYIMSKKSLAGDGIHMFDRLPPNSEVFLVVPSSSSVHKRIVQALEDPLYHA